LKRKRKVKKTSINRHVANRSKNPAFKKWTGTRERGVGSLLPVLGIQTRNR